MQKMPILRGRWTAGRHRLSLAAVALLAAIVFLCFLGRARITTSHEARVAVTARTMARSGLPWSARHVTVPRPVVDRSGGKIQLIPDPAGRTISVNPWLLPVFWDRLRLQKPPLPYWFAAVGFSITDNAMWASRTLPALLGVAGVFLIHDLARRLHGRRAAMIAALVWTSTHFIVAEYRKAMADPYLAFSVLAAVWAWIALAHRHERRQTSALTACFYAAIALGLLAKGPVILLHVALAIAAYAAAFRRWPRISPWAHMLGILAVIAVCLPWPLYVLMHVPDGIDVWRYESVGELADNMRNARPWYYYLPVLPQLALPWTPILIATGVLLYRRPRRRLLFPALWIAATVLFFSFVNLKKAAYLLPVMPAFTLLITATLTSLAAIQRRSPHRDARAIRLLIVAEQALVAAVAVVVVAWAVQQFLTGIRGESQYGVPAIAASVAAAALILGFYPFRPAVAATIPRWTRAQAICAALLVALFLATIDAHRHNRRPSALDAPPATQPADTQRTSHSLL